jgi:isopentenyl-diphosphate delta-isomerase
MELEMVVLVTEQDEEIGTMEKMQAHKMGVLHRAFSVFIFNDAGDMLLQRRAARKYHSAGPRPGENVVAAAHRRLREELNFDAELEALQPMLYKADVGENLTEHEYDHLFVGLYSLPVKPAPAEVSEARYVGLRELEEWMQTKPEDFTTWFRLAVPRILMPVGLNSKSQDSGSR